MRSTKLKSTRSVISPHYNYGYSVLQGVVMTKYGIVNLEMNAINRKKPITKLTMVFENRVYTEVYYKKYTQIGCARIASLFANKVAAIIIANPHYQ